MKSITPMIILVFLMFCFCLNGVFAADSNLPPFEGMQFAVSSYYYPGNGLDWGGYNDINDDGIDERHLADDFCLKEGDTVFAPISGIIKFARPWKTCPQWIHLTVIEAITFDGSIKCFVLGHVKPSVAEGTIVNQGDKVGNVTDYWCSCDHVHYGVLNEPYVITDPKTGYDGAVSGYLSPDKWPPVNYLDPIEFTLSQIFDYHYQTSGGVNKYGTMINPEQKYGKIHWHNGVHWYNELNAADKQNCYIRDYEHDKCNGHGAIVFDSLNGAHQAYGLICLFADFWFKNGGPKSVLGMPIGDEY